MCLRQTRRSGTCQKFRSFAKGNAEDFASSATLVLLLLLAVFIPRANSEELIPELPEKYFAFFENYCLDCHDAITEKGSVNLEDLSFQVTTIQEAELWQKVLNTMNAGEMPPEDKKQPEESEKADFLDALAGTMVDARRSLSDTGGEITMRRLNRREYQNSMASLLGFEIDVSTLPADGGGSTFDTEGASQFISSDQIEQYLKLGRSAIGEWLERRAASQQPAKVFRVEPESTVNVQSREAMAKQEEIYERYLGWKAGVDKAALLPENAEALAQIREKYRLEDVTGNLRLYQNANLLKGGPDPKEFGFRDDNAASFSYQGGYGRTYAYMKQYLEFPNSDRGTYLKLAWAIQRIDVVPDPEDLPPGTYKLRIRAGSVEGSDPSRHFIEVGHPQRVNQVPYGFSSKPIASLQVTGTEENPEIIETTVVINSDTPREFGIQERVPADSKKTISREFYRFKRENGYGTPPAIWVDWIELEGPLSNSVVTASKTHRVEPEKTVNVKNLEITKSQEKKYKEKWLPWKEGVEKAAKDPANEEVMAELRQKHPDLDANPFELYKNAERLKGAPDPTKFGFGDPINAVAHYRSIQRQLDYTKHYAELPHNDRGAYLKLSSGIQRFDVSPDPKDMPPGSYKLRVRAGAVEGSDPSRHFIEIGHPQRRTATSLGFSKLLTAQQVSGTIENPQIIEVDIEIGINTPRDFGIQERQPKSEKLLRKEFDRHKAENGYGTPPAIWVDWIELEGPIPDGDAPTSKLTRIEPEETINPANEAQIASIEDAQARSAEWQKGVDAVINTPANQAKIAEIRKTQPKIDHPQWGYAFAEQLEGTPDARDFGFTDAQKAAASDPEGDRANLAYHKHYASLPHRDRGTYLKVAHGTGRIIVAPEEMPPGSYTLRVAAAAVEGSPASRHFIEVGHPQREIAPRDWGLEGKAISSHQVTGTIENPQVIEIPIEVGTDTIKEFAIQEKQPNNGNLKALWGAHNEWKAKNGYGHPPAIWIDWVELEGPHPLVKTTQSEIHRVEPEKTINPRNEKEIKRMEDAFERYAQWQKLVDQAAKTPENQAIIAEIAKKEPRILDPLRFYQFTERLKGIPDARDFGFEDARAPQSANRDWPNLHAYYTHYANLPHRDTGAYLKPTKGTGRVIVAPEKLPIGNYTLRVRVGAVEGSDPSRHFIQVGHPQRTYTKLEFDHGFEGREITTNQVTGTIAEPQVIEIPLEVGPNTPSEFSVQEKQPNNGKIQALWKTFNAAKKKNGYGAPPAIWIDWVELEGPHGAPPSESNRDDWWITEADDPDEASRARTILENFAVTAFRGVDAEEDFLDRLSAIYETRRAAGDTFDQALELPLAVILSSPGFLYFNEPNDADERRELTDRELSVRLAYFLWSAPPDEELLSLAQNGELSNPNVLRAQVDRLIADSRSDEFVAGFLHQWLDMERLDFFQFDTTLYRDFDESTRAAARQEVYQSFAHLLRNDDGHLGQLLKSDYVFVNGLLATYYGLEGVTGDQFQKVSLPAGSPRGGLLGMAAIHAMGSDGIESSPVERGAWVLRHILNDPPPPAPPNVPQLSRLADEPLTTRQKLAAHMEEAQCASCHRKIDPIGFGLENFDAAGKWRTEEGHGRNVHPIDPADQFHNGPKFADYFELRDIIAEREPDFARGFTEHLIGYGLGRPFGFTDENLADEIVAAAKQEDYTVREFIQALVSSERFNQK